MSVVAVKVTDKIITIGADSQTTNYSHNKTQTNKIFKINKDFIIGGVGYASHNQMMRLFCQTNKPASTTHSDIIDFFIKFDEFLSRKMSDYKAYNDWLLVYKDKCFKVSSDLYCREVTDYDAIGSGHEFSKAALYLGHTVEESLKVACDLTIYCSEPLEIFKVKLK